MKTFSGDQPDGRTIDVTMGSDTTPVPGATISGGSDSSAEVKEEEGTPTNSPHWKRDCSEYVTQVRGSFKKNETGNPNDELSG